MGYYQHPFHGQSWGVFSGSQNFFFPGFFGPKEVCVQLLKDPIWAVEGTYLQSF